MSIRYPNANHPLPYDEADMVKTDDVAVNEAGGLLTNSEAGAGYGPLLELTGLNVPGVTASGEASIPITTAEVSSEPEPVEEVVEAE